MITVSPNSVFVKKSNSTDRTRKTAIASLSQAAVICRAMREVSSSTQGTEGPNQMTGYGFDYENFDARGNDTRDLLSIRYDPSDRPYRYSLFLSRKVSGSSVMEQVTMLLNKQATSDSYRCSWYVGVVGMSTGQSDASKTEDLVSTITGFAQVKASIPAIFSSYADCSSTTAPSGTNGSCGSANGQTFDTAPRSGLCSSGTAQGFSGNGPWTWVCAGSDGGSSASCTAYKSAGSVNGVCGADHGRDLPSRPTALCSAGTATSIVSNGFIPGANSGYWIWSCQGSGGGTSASCRADYDRGSGGTNDQLVNFDRYCREQGYVSGASNIDGTGYGWKCQPGSVGIDVDHLCRSHYGQGYSALLKSPPPGGANDWRCHKADSAGTNAPLVIEFYNAPLDHYFITANSGEAGGIDQGQAGSGWSRTGKTFKSGGSTSVCRFYGSVSPGPNSHFYTLAGSECDELKALQRITPASQKRWNFESLDFVSSPLVNGACSTGTTPVYRAYNNGNSRGIDSNHRITSDYAAIQQTVARGWRYEGVVMCAPQ